MDSARTTTAGLSVPKASISHVHANAVVERALGLRADGYTPTQIRRRLGVPTSTVQYWCRGGRSPRSPRPVCARCHGLPLDERQDAYLLGDGYISTPKGSVASLSLYCADDWPGVRHEVHWTQRRTPTGTRRYEYPRYFSNESTDILDICADALDRLGIAHRRPRRNAISVARKEAVARLDEVVGPKS